MATTPLHISVIAGSTREGRFSDQAAAWIAAELGKHEGVTPSVLDLRDYDLPFFDAPINPALKQEPYAHPEVARFTAAIAASDAYVIIAPEYNHGPTAVLKNAMDWVYQEWNRKPVAFVGYGSVGGARAVEQLRQIAVELHMAPVRNAVHIPGDRYFGMRFGGQPTADELFASLEKQAALMIDDLRWWGSALKAAREG